MIEGTKPFAAIVLAAGASRRFGGVKALYAIEGRTLLERSVTACTGAGASAIVVVTGAHPAVATAASSLGATVVENTDWERGMGTSLAVGVRAARRHGEVSALVLLPVDLPAIRSAHVAALVAAVTPDRAAARLWPDGRLGTPVALPLAWTDDLLASLDAHPDRGAGPFLQTRKDGVIPVDLPDLGDDLDRAR